MTEELPAFDSDVLRALEAERARPELGPSERARVSALLQESLPQLAWPAAAHALAHTVSTHRAVEAAHAAPKLMAKAAVGGGLKLALVAAVSASVGGVGGAALHARFAKPVAVVAPVVTLPQAAPQLPPAVPALAPLPAPAPAPLPAPLPGVAPPAPRPHPAAKPTAVAEPDVDLRREQGLVDRARSALARRELHEADAALTAHAERFPHGQLSEERDGLRVQLLVALDRGPAARVAAAAFKQRYPDSLLWASIERALSQLP